MRGPSWSQPDEGALLSDAFASANDLSGVGELSVCDVQWEGPRVYIVAILSVENGNPGYCCHAGKFKKGT